ncbi:MAG: hypothetical protein A2Y45_08225 [Tenericutes bacterium GWC2_34_14]|nr:MAG: hypothetical protein A2Z84_03250 [Tenericutes bacterium GWA2_35_7]OHE29882.1 MAG: hypothetical protein A2Y45_08225 [Tenericutes bacterium GWC2_34_14]OHE34861.1 MAG: hypothetical protein A2012_01835 [Tenericutes bacterium GWE2_34_108]OHE37278.1 MAG: hypothetical protein A2Y46_01175 [Tenericutes bacterium GWF1_35_14]OHE39589.1 MAG: hypothetical protein A2Y44_01685 [Tenericutes bacterium GWF2_35_184]OHE41291.1 MAG: hypothetical protein A3K26_06320 [Tenericutes bacterium RIFOXYA12_FULL_35_
MKEDGYFKAHNHREQLRYDPSIINYIQPIERKTNLNKNKHEKRILIERIQMRDLYKFIISENSIHRSVVKI